MSLSAEERVQVRALWTRDGNVVSLEKPAFQAAVAAVDAWIDANTASFLAALPSAFASASTATQKQLLFLYVLLRRMGRT